MTATATEPCLAGPPPDLLDRGQLARLILALTLGRGEAGITEDEVRAAHAKVNAILLMAETVGLVLEGRVGIDVREGDVVFREADDVYRTRFAGGVRRARV